MFFSWKKLNQRIRNIQIHVYFANFYVTIFLNIAIEEHNLHIVWKILIKKYSNG
jgi:hypothetical protein